ncbi:MAG: WG repeat-containing protein, partial [Balneola sp.]
MKSKLITTLFLLLIATASCNVVDSISGNEENDNTVELYPILLDGEWGYIDKNGSVKIEPQFQNADVFSDGLARVRYRWSWKYINENGDFEIEGDFQSIENFNDGLAAVRIDDRWGYINKKGNFAVNPRFRSAYPFSSGRAFVRSTDYSEYYYIDKNGIRIESVSLPNDMDFVENNTFS